MRIADFDIEADDKDIRNITKIHCIVIIDDEGVHEYRPHEIEQGVRRLQEYDLIAAHNGVSYDVPALRKFYRWFKPPKVLDTLLVSRLMYPDHTQNPLGGHSLSQWGAKLKEPKDDYSGGWDEFNEEMMAYCVQDVRVLRKIRKAQTSFIKKHRPAVRLEHNVAEFIAWQCRNGCGFRRERAETLRRRLTLVTDNIEQALQECFPPHRQEMKTPAYWVGRPIDDEEDKHYPTKKDAIADGCPAGKVIRGPNRVKETPFNPGSRDQIGKRLIEKYGWKPTKRTETGKPQIDESVLSKLDYPEAKMLNRYLMIDKKLSMIDSWLKADEDGIIYGSIITNGTITGRMSHSNPNLGQVPSAEKVLGKACRSCFGPTRPGWVQLGGDLSGLELRMLANRLWPWDKGAFAQQLMEGDIHTHVQGIVNSVLTEKEQITRRTAKGVMYAIVYGAGPTKIATMLEVSQSKGKKVLETLKSKITGLRELLRWIQDCVERHGYLRGLDGRPLPIRKAYSALNTLLQSDGALIGKLAWVLFYRKIVEKPFRGHIYPILNVHDEQQSECRTYDIADKAGKELVQCMVEAGKKLKVQLPTDGDYKIGFTWRHCH